MLVDINLLPQKEKRSRVVIIVLLAGLLASLAGAGWTYFYQSILNQELSNVKQQLELTKNLRMVQEQKVNEATSSSSVQMLEEKVRWIEQIPTSTVAILNEVVGLLPERGFFLQYQYTVSGDIMISAQFDTVREVSAYLAELKEAPFVEGVQMANVATSPVTLPDHLQGDNESSSKYMPRYIAQFTIKLNQQELIALKEAKKP